LWRPAESAYQNKFVETIVCVLWRRLDDQNFKCWPHVCKGSESIVLIRYFILAKDEKVF